MKRLVLMILTAATLVLGMQAVSLASDWDKAGKVLAVFEGLRVITGGRADIVGTVTGINKPRESARECREIRECDRSGRRDSRRTMVCVRRMPCEREKIWVPHYVWEERYVPEHYEYKPGVGEIFVGSHYERFKVEQGGHWEYR